MEYPKPIILTISLMLLIVGASSSTIIQKQPNNSIIGLVQSALGYIRDLLTPWKHNGTNNKPYHKLVPRDTVDDMDMGSTITRQENSCYFEDYEKQYYIYQIRNLLLQIIAYKKYKDNQGNQNATDVSEIPHLPEVICARTSVTSSPSASPSVTSTLPLVTTTQGFRATAWDEATLHRLQHMSLHQLDKLFHRVEDSVQTGKVDVSISNLCCSI